MRDPLTGHVLNEIAPVRADIADRGTGPALLRLESPREVCGFEQPVLKVAAVNEVQCTQVAGGDHRPRLLDQRVAAIVEGDRMHDASACRGVEQAAGLGSSHRQRLVRDNVFVMGERRHDHRRVQIIGRRVVHDVYVRIARERFVAAVGLRHPERVGLSSRRFLSTARDRNDVDEAKSPHRINVVHADKARADEAHADPRPCHASTCLA